VSRIVGVDILPILDDLMFVENVGEGCVEGMEVVSPSFTLCLKLKSVSVYHGVRLV